MSPPRGSRRRVLRVLATLLLLAPRAARGHASLARSIPARRAVLMRAPERVQLWFSEPLEPRFCRLSVWTADGRQVDQGDLALEPDEPRRLSVGLPSLPPGRYLVRFRVLSIDGHVVEESYPFTVEHPR